MPALGGLLLIPECQAVPSSKQIPVPSRVDLSRVRKQQVVLVNPLRSLGHTQNPGTGSLL